MIEKPKRPKKIPNQDNKQPQTIQELIRRYDLDNTKIYDFLDELVENINKTQEEEYSSQEVRTNKKWIDGKPIYRKVISFVPTALTGLKSYEVDNVENVVKLEGVMYYSSDNIFPINFAFTQNSTVYHSLFWVSVEKGSIRYNISELYKNKECTIIMEYTKTTD